jgi:hypothetical protein
VGDQVWVDLNPAPPAAENPHGLRQRQKRTNAEATQ